MSDYLVLDADLYIPTGVPATAEQVAAWLEDGVITQDVFDQLGPEQTTVAEPEEDALSVLAAEILGGGTRA